MSFYHLSDQQVLLMPAYRFWALEKQITRVRAEADLRLINIERSTTTQDAMSDVVEMLTLELGETCKIERVMKVKAEPGAKAKFKKMMR